MERAHCVMVEAGIFAKVGARAFLIVLALVWTASHAALGQCLWSSGTSGAIYYNGGNVGIGTNNPGQKLDVAGAINLSAAVQGSASQYWIGRGIALANGTIALNAPANQGVEFGTGGEVKMVVVHAGDVGIGTTSPYHYDGMKSLTIGGQNGGEVRVGQSTGWCQGQFYSYCDATVLGSVYGTPLVLRTNANEKMRITPGGNVGIGTTNPGLYRLAVNGTVGAKEVIVTSSGWPDYVFRPGYRLRPLSEVERFIQKHRHLPGIPAERQVKAKGVSLGEMQAKLLAQVEELTLHLIRQEKENRELRERVARLEQGAGAAR